MGIKDVWHPVDCTVIAVKPTDGPMGYGNRVYVKDALGYKMMYAHLDWYAVKPGDKIKAGSVFAEIGETGYCPHGAHLHCSFFHVFCDELFSHNAVDPLPYFEKYGFPCHTIITNYYGNTNEDSKHPQQKFHEGLDFSSWRKRV